LPDIGGDTLFANMVMAYESLDEELQQRLCQMTAVHDIARVFAKRLGKDASSLHEKYPPQEHPVVGTDPETGKRLIYVNVAFTDHI
jgi:taurine dioxygenase